MCEAREGGDQDLIGQPNWFYWFQRWSNLWNKTWVFTLSCSPKEVSFRYQQPESFIRIIRRMTSSTCKSNFLYYIRIGLFVLFCLRANACWHAQTSIICRTSSWMFHIAIHVALRVVGWILDSFIAKIYLECTKSFWIKVSAKFKALCLKRVIMDSLMSSLFVPPFSLISLHAWLSVGGMAKSSILRSDDWIFHIKPDWSQRVTSLVFVRRRQRGGTAGSPRL